ncbi:ankyrin repeat domain-containing protein [Nocardioides terrigena]|uniref:ankyrin repeat domain-containing protein n=1 Tax=Nocardioides terrigena TaxID=424797 RepID=UPI001F2D0841|nr:ankyrin repeat domain-containing protein [Nocardioides terrigena]
MLRSVIVVTTTLVVLAASGCATDTDDATGDPAASTPSAASTNEERTTPPATPEPTLSATPEKDETVRDLSPDPEQQAALDERLRDAAWANDVPLARRLVSQGADVNAKDQTEQSAYLIATSEGHLDLLRLTLQNGAEVDDKDSWNGTGLIRAAERGHGLVVGELLRAGIDRDHVNRIGYQAIHEAIWLGEDTPSYATTVRVLAAGGVQLDHTSPSAGLTPLEMAAERSYPGLELILRTMTTTDRPHDPDATLLRAAEAGDPDTVAVALRAGADIEARDERDRTALLLASALDHVATAELLVAMGADPDALDDRHDTPWLVTGVTGSVAMLEALLPAHPDLTIRNRFGGLSPIPASERGHVDYVRRVVQTPVDLDHVNDLGWTAMLEAVILGDGGRRHQQIVQILLDAGADPTIPDSDGVTPLQHAQRRDHDRLASILRRHTP